jgi:hypothetical protein
MYTSEIFSYGKYISGSIYFPDKAMLSSEPTIRMSTASKGQAVPVSTFITQQASVDGSQVSEI